MQPLSQEEFSTEIERAKEGKRNHNPWGSSFSKAPEILHGAVPVTPLSHTQRFGFHLVFSVQVVERAHVCSSRVTSEVIRSCLHVSRSQRGALTGLHTSCSRVAPLFASVLLHHATSKDVLKLHQTSHGARGGKICLRLASRSCALYVLEPCDLVGHCQIQSS